MVNANECTVYIMHTIKDEYKDDEYISLWTWWEDSIKYYVGLYPPVYGVYTKAITNLVDLTEEPDTVIYVLYDDNRVELGYVIDQETADDMLSLPHIRGYYSSCFWLPKDKMIFEGETEEEHEEREREARLELKNKVDEIMHIKR